MYTEKLALQSTCLKIQGFGWNNFQRLKKGNRKTWFLLKLKSASTPIFHPRF